MIHVVSPPGCYGSYLMQCIYLYSDLGNKTNKPKLKIDQITGSSHKMARESDLKLFLNCFHLTNKVIPCKSDYNDFIVILPNPNNCLDYANNQFVKQYYSNIPEFIKSHESSDIIEYKLKKFWNYSGVLDNSVPKWIIREFISLWLEDSWNFGYNRSFYKKFPSNIKIETEQLFDSKDSIIVDTIAKINLNLTASINEIKQQTNYWIKYQKFHNIQSKCDSWIESVLSNTYQKNPCLTILDEAYVQMVLRKMDYEIKCENLLIFPKSSLKMADLIY